MNVSTNALAQALGLPPSELARLIAAAQVADTADCAALFGGDIISRRELDMVTGPVSLAKPAAPKTYDLHELGNSARLVDRHGDDIRYVADLGRWLVWTGERWEYDRKDAKLLRLAADAMSALGDEAAVKFQAAITAESKEARAEAEGAAKRVLNWRDRSMSLKALKATIALAASEPLVQIQSAQLDADPMLLGVTNGVVDLATGELLPPSREHLITRSAGTHYDPAAQATRWEQFVTEICNEDAAMAGYLQRAVGYTLTGSVVEETLFQLLGVGSNGKSKFIAPLLRMFGAYGQKAPVSLLYDTGRDGGPTTAHMRMHGVRLSWMSEAKESQRVSEGLLKEITSTEEQVARPLYADEVQFSPTHHIWLTTNAPLLILGTDNGIWRRLATVPFKRSFEGAEKDEHLEAKLLAELPGILSWAVRGCLDYQRQGLAMPAPMKAYNDECRARMDSLGTFINEACITGGKYKSSLSQFYSAYCAYAEERGEMPPKMRIISERLERKGYEIRKSSTMHIYGLGLLADKDTQTMSKVQPINRARALPC
ncbi:MAG: phage/plasmid primase, P4 family [Pseudomonadota bacterium]|nr:phage/plasmid primase, P4 family [Pseudomonadota bacterium]MDP1905170.1 phage/plasmid primase, P4 family [Pseudomonadota bacterium]